MVSNRDLSHLITRMCRHKIDGITHYAEMPMLITYKTLLFSHIVLGFASLILFWIPIFAKKGSAWHIRTGHWYAKVMYGVGITALVISVMTMVDPLSLKFPDQEFSAVKAAEITTQAKAVALFLLAISILTISNLRHGLLSLKAKKNHALMRRSDNLLLNGALLAIGLILAYSAVGGSPMAVLFYIFAGLCIITAGTNLRFCLKPKVTRGEQIIAHIGGLVGAGIGSHTAFFVFGASRYLSEFLSGYAGMIPWVLPGIIGTIIIRQQSRKYRPRKAKAA